MCSGKGVSYPSPQHRGVPLWRSAHVNKGPLLMALKVSPFGGDACPSHWPLEGWVSRPQQTAHAIFSHRTGVQTACTDS